MREKNEALSPPRVAFSGVGWISRVLAFRSFYYPWGQMGTTRSLKKQENAYILSQDSSQDFQPRLELGRNTGSVICNPLPEILATLEVTLSEICGQKWNESGLLNEVSCLIQGSEIKDFCLKQGQCLQASESSAPLPKLHLTAPPPPPDHALHPTHDPRDIKRSDVGKTWSQATHRSGGPSRVCRCGFAFTSISATHDPGIRGYSL